MKKTLSALLLVILCSGCKQASNGRYTVSAIKEGKYYNGDNDSLANALKASLLGERFDILFHESTVAIRSLKTHTELQLTSEKFRNKPYYKGSFTQDSSTYEVVLKYDTSYVMDVRHYMPDGIPINKSLPLSTHLKEATIECYLSKVN